MCNSVHRQSGNVIFFIMIAIALFAGLAYAVTDSMKGGGKSIEGDKAKLAALHMINVADSIEKGVNRVMMVNDCRITEIDLSPLSNASNVNAPSDGRCHVFDVRGGQVSHAKFPEEYSDVAGEKTFGVFSSYAYPNVGSSCTNASCVDIALYTRDVKKEVCVAINNALGVQNTGGNPPTVGDLSAGTFTDGAITYNGVLSNAALDAKTAACVRESTGCGSGACYAFYHIIYTQ